VVLVPLVTIIGCAGALWYNEKDMPPVAGHPFRAHLDSASESATLDELGWAAATALAHARGQKEEGAEPCEIGERLVTGRLATFEASTAALAALKALEAKEPGDGLVDARLFNHDGSPYDSLTRKFDRTSDRWRYDANFGIDGELVSFHFSWDVKVHLLTLDRVTTGAPPPPSPTPSPAR
jgi:hypothetical protein